MISFFKNITDLQLNLHASTHFIFYEFISLFITHDDIDPMSYSRQNNLINFSFNFGHKTAFLRNTS